MYEEFYGLIEEPFNTTPDPKFLYLSESHEEGLAHLLFGVERKKGLIVLTGEIGTGKTTLLNSLVQRLDEKTHVAFLVNSQVTLLDIFQYIFSEFGLPERGQTKGEYLIELKKFLQQCSKAGEKVVLIVDEAQNLSLEVLEELRLLTNFETPKEKLIQIILVGQPPLDDKLSLPELAQLKQRIGVNYHLLPLSFQETKGYIDKRLTVAGATYPIFRPEAIEEIYRYSGGIPRIINIMGDLALFFGVADQKREIGRATILQVAESLHYKLGSPDRWKTENRGGKNEEIDPADAIIIKHSKGSIVQDIPELSRPPERAEQPRRSSSRQNRKARRRLLRPVRFLIAALVMLAVVLGGIWTQKIEDAIATIEKFSQTVWQYYTEKFSSSETASPPVNTEEKVNKVEDIAPVKITEPVASSGSDLLAPQSGLPSSKDTARSAVQTVPPMLSPNEQLRPPSPRIDQAESSLPNTLTETMPQTNSTSKAETSNLQEQLQEPKVVLVQPGDNLTAIILKEYGKFNATILSQIQRANPGIIDPSHIEAGQRIIPPFLEEPVKSAIRNPNSEIPTPQSEIQPGAQP